MISDLFPELKSNATLINDDCIKAMKSFPDNTFDSIITDPPYGISFMNKHWDYDVPSTEVWEECLRITKPGAHILVACGTRTQHVMACRIEDAGYDIKDIVVYSYSTGFPKSLDVSKQIDKLNGRTQESNKLLAEYLKSRREALGLSKSDLDDKLGTTTLYSWYEGRPAGTQLPTKKHYQKLKEVLQLDDRFDELIERIEAKREVIGQNYRKTSDSAVPISPRSDGLFDITAPALPDAQKWAGWGTGLKPAMELWTLARKPISESTITDNVLKHGTGALNINASRIPTTDPLSGGKQNEGMPIVKEGGWDRPWKHDEEAIEEYKKRKEEKTKIAESLGRWPANFIHDGSPEVVDQFPNAEGKDNFRHSATSIFGSKPKESTYNGESKSSFGSASRFFYCAKVSPSERGSNTHPTVKPLTLMRYLCKLITPPKGHILDPFMGSGSTGVAAIECGFQFTGIELEPEYFKICKDRIP